MGTLQVLPLTQYQKEIYYETQRNPESQQFTISIARVLKNNINVEKLFHSVNTILGNDITCRLRIVEHEGVLGQEIQSTVVNQAKIINAEEEDVNVLFDKWSKRVFNLDEKSLLEIALLQNLKNNCTAIFIRAHHIVCDGWGINQLAKKIAKCYLDNHLIQGNAAASDMLSYSSHFEKNVEKYTSAILEQEKILSQPETEQQITALAALTQHHDPAFFNRKKKTHLSRFVQHRHILTQAEIEKTTSQGMNPYLAVMSAVAVLLSRIHNNTQLTMGVPLLNRRKNQLDIAGQWANTLPLAVTVNAEDTFAELATRIKTGTKELKTFEHIPLGRLFKSMGTTVRQWFDVTVAYNHSPMTGASRDTYQKEGIYAAATAHENDAIAIHVHNYGGDSDVAIDITAAEDIFDEDYSFETFTASLGHVLDQIIASPEQAVSQVTLSSAEEMAQLALFEQGPVTAFSAQETLSTLFDAQVSLHGDAVAIANVGEQSALTYAQFQARIDNMVAILLKAGVKKGDIVAILMDRSTEMLTAIFAVLKAGAAYLPVDPNYPQERIDYMLEDSGVTVIIADKLNQSLSTRAYTVIDGNNVVDHEVQRDAEQANLSAADSLAYMIYTSGSTGQPKGVMINHYSAVNRIEWMQERYPLDNTDVILQKTPISFDVSVWELFWWSITGASVHLLPPGAHKDPLEIIKAISTHRVTTLHFVPSMLQPLLDILEAQPELVKKLDSLRRVFTSGEALPPTRVNQFRQIFSVLGLNAPALINLYGPTEATVDVSYFEFFPENVETVKRVPIGFPINNTSLRIMSQHGTRQAIGLAGELQIGGVGLARGYHNKPELTDEKFILSGNERWYRTGDLARWLPDGSIEYLGRIDNQVKIRGNRIELGEIQNTLERIQGINRAEVLPQKNSQGDDYLCAYYTVNIPNMTNELSAADHLHFTSEKLRNALLEFLPDFMVPQRFFRVPFIPLTPNGKVDRHALVALVKTEEAASRDDAQSETEYQLADIWKRILKIEKLSVQENFYTLGGDSILMLKVRSEAEKAGITVTLSDLAQYLTIAELGQHIDANCKNQQSNRQNALLPFALIKEKERASLAQYADAFPATQLQLGLIYHSQQSKNSATYKDVFRYTLKINTLTRRWEPEHFRQSAAATIQRHPVLRSHFNLADFSEPLQIINYHIDLDEAVKIDDLSSLTRDESESIIKEHMEKSSRLDYQFDHAPLYCIHVFKTAATDIIEVVFSFHHALLDGGSVANLLHELFSRYLNKGMSSSETEGSETKGSEANAVEENILPSPALYVQDELHALQDQKHQLFWKKMFKGLARTQFPAYRLYENRTDENRAYERQAKKRIFAKKAFIPKEMEEKLGILVQHEQVSIKSVFFAAHCLTVASVTSQDQIATGLVTHGRPDVQHSEQTLGLFLNTLPVRFSAANKTWKECIHSVFSAEQRHAPYRKYPLNTIQQKAGEGAKISSAFNYIHFHILTDVFGGSDLSLIAFDPWEETNFEVLLNVMTDFNTGQHYLRCDFDGSVFSQVQADTYMDTYMSVLNKMVNHGDQPATLSQPLAQMTQKIQSSSDMPCQGFMSVLNMIAKNVREQPDAIAIRHHDLQWSYKKLWSESGKIASALISEGIVYRGTVYPGSVQNTPVAIALERSPILVASLLGVMRAGGICLPLDLSYPIQRIEAMVEQAHPILALVDEKSEQLLNAVAVPAMRSDTLINLDTSISCEEQESGAEQEIDPEQLAYLLFTSGSTGKPKGVAMPHRSLSNMVTWQNETITGKNIRSTLQYAPLSFDVSFQEIFSTLAAGGELHLISEDERRDPLQLLRAIDHYQTERIYLPYVALQQLAETAVALETYPINLKTVISSGEQLRVTDDIRSFIGQINNGILENQYGPTETHVITAFTMQGNPVSFPALPPIGKSISNTDVVLLNDQLEEVASGEQGEIYARGLPVAQGYYCQPTLTAERFIMLKGDNNPLYRTGDLGVKLRDGNILCLGRKDTQVKVRGYRIELAEIELAISNTSGADAILKDVAVVVQQHGENDGYLVAFLVGERNDAFVVQVQQYLSETLPKHMLPSQIEWLDSLPKTPSGKRDDAALRQMRITHGQTQAEGVAPRDKYEQVLCDLAADLLKIPDVSVHQNLFDIGATSLTVMRMVVLVEKHFGTTIPLSLFISYPTVAQLAEHIREKGGHPTFSPLVPMRPLITDTNGRHTTGHKSPLFFVHPMGGNVLSYLRLVKHLPEDQPFYALQSHGVDAGSVPLTSVQEQAANYLQAIRHIQPHGPYSIGGWSYGGFVAFEMARQLKEQGEEVADLFVLDTVVVSNEAKREVNEEALLRWFFWELLWLNEGATLPAQSLPEHTTSLQEQFEYITEQAIATDAIPKGSSRAVIQRLFDVYRTNWKAASDYAACKADISMTLLHATRPLPEVLHAMHDAVGSEYRDPQNGWGRKTTGHINVIDVPGDHLEVMEEPYVEEVAKVILQEMNKSSKKQVLPYSEEECPIH
ncbi:linear gramicidin synthetase subunit D [Xenorhabdus mauleonii]|uniref:Amino acid adenylation domain-containing protein n=1 Tax=Xenorhabdus mauleonii TaxID=351675 RepID=A0A1I3QZZ2_9GAMM|nr:non-ribosomal peptide synthetase [Xenorhabdus mauleonii]PHM38685.1 linear gramicidin synthetase subunit D [Xenorhabdus mauleonii]SFJ38646.1 amino acid adenylation domain-containing protein [Xenorhabdus mauleonii]